MEHRRKNTRNEDSPPHDFPTYSRLFIVCDKKLSEDQFNDAFSSFGHIEDIKMPRDRNTGDTKGIVYIKFSKTSEAALALEKMNKKIILESTRPLKVMVAANRSDIQSEDDEEKYKRLFITVPLDMQEDDIKRAFSPFGNVEDIYLQRDKSTGKPNGFAYVTYTLFSEAAIAFEKSNPKFRAIFALPKDSKRRSKNYESSINSLPPSCNVNSSLLSVMSVHPEGYTRVQFMCSPYLTQMHVEKLFDLIPGFLNCKYVVDLMNASGNGTATYANPTCATYAVQKLNQFEYPPGTKFFVRPDNSLLQNDQKFGNIPNVVRNIKNAIASSANSSTPDLVQLAEVIAEASKLLKTATSTVTNDITDSTYCSVKLPPPQPLADIDSPLAKRCFLICKPQPPPLAALRDVFCRFGDLINVYTLPGKTIGYARFASNSAADKAIMTLHGAEICGVRIKVIEAEDEAPPKKKKYCD